MSKQLQYQQFQIRRQVKYRVNPTISFSIRLNNKNEIANPKL